MDKANIAGVVLAGGQSSRMGQSKALLDYNGVSLLDHMIGILNKAGLGEIYVSGEFEGYNCIPDSTQHDGPACAICDVLSALKSYDGVLFVPVDMPFLTADILGQLLSQKNGAYFKNYPLPAFIKRSSIPENISAVHELLSEMNVPALSLPVEFERSMGNMNTPQEWQEALRV